MHIHFATFENVIDCREESCVLIEHLDKTKSSRSYRLHRRNLLDPVGAMDLVMCTSIYFSC